MIKRLFLVLVLALSVSLFAGQGKSIGKPTFLLLWSDSCPHCTSFINNSLRDKKVKEILRNFNVEAVNVNEDSNVPYDIDFTGVVPSIHILNNKKSQLVNTITGDIPAENLVQFLTKFLELYKEYERSL